MMKMFKVNSFLFCMRLETAGLLLGWLSLIFHGSLFAAAAISSIYYFISTSFIDQEKIKPYDEKLGNALMTIVAIFGVFFLILAWNSWSCISAVVNRRHQKLTPMLYQLALNFIATVLIIFADSNSTDDRLVYTVQGCVWAYLFICTYSLKSKFRDEAKSQLGANDISMA